MPTRTSMGVAAWGIQGTATGVAGVITDIDDSSKPLLAPEYNEAGQVIKQTHYDTQGTVSFTVEVAAGTAKPEAGTQITINGHKGYVTESKVTESNQAYRKIAVTAEFYKNCDHVTPL